MELPKVPRLPNTSLLGDVPKLSIPDTTVSALNPLPPVTPPAGVTLLELPLKVDLLSGIGVYSPTAAIGKIADSIPKIPSIAAAKDSINYSIPPLPKPPAIDMTPIKDLQNTVNGIKAQGAAMMTSVMAQAAIAMKAVKDAANGAKTAATGVFNDAVSAATTAANDATKAAADYASSLTDPTVTPEQLQGLKDAKDAADAAKTAADQAKVDAQTALDAKTAEATKATTDAAAAEAKKVDAEKNEEDQADAMDTESEEDDAADEAASGLSACEQKFISLVKEINGKIDVWQAAFDKNLAYAAKANDSLFGPSDQERLNYYTEKERLDLMVEEVRSLKLTLRGLADCAGWVNEGPNKTKASFRAKQLEESQQ
jgi:hypothetical protein